VGTDEPSRRPSPRPGQEFAEVVELMELLAVLRRRWSSAGARHPTDREIMTTLRRLIEDPDDPSEPYRQTV